METRRFIAHWLAHTHTHEWNERERGMRWRREDVSLRHFMNTSSAEATERTERDTESSDGTNARTCAEPALETSSF